jgi:hypothetical protein
LTNANKYSDTTFIYPVSFTYIGDLNSKESWPSSPPKPSSCRQTTSKPR